MVTDGAMRTDSQARPMGGSQGHAARGVNVGNGERMPSVLGGAALGLYGLGRLRLSGLVLAALGGALVYRGLSGHCKVSRPPM